MESGYNPLVSILIPLYNHDRYITQCLDSILNDPYPAKEIIILDDGSTDNSVQVVKEWYSKNREKIAGRFELKNQNNHGLCATLNKLVNLAKGDYIALLASDDHLLPGGIQARVDYLEKHNDKMAVFGDCIVIDSNDKLIYKSGIENLHHGRKKYLINDSLLGYELIFHWCVPGPVFMAKRDTYKAIGLYDETLAVEDWDYYLRLVSQSALGFIDYPVAAYRHHETNMVRVWSRSDWIRWPLDTLTKNIDRFTGLKKVYLMANKIRKTGEQYSYDGKVSIGIIYRLWAKISEKSLETLYETMVILQVKFNIHLLRGVLGLISSHLQ